MGVCARQCKTWLRYNEVGRRHGKRRRKQREEEIIRALRTPLFSALSLSLSLPCQSFKWLIFPHTQTTHPLIMNLSSALISERNTSHFSFIRSQKRETFFRELFDCCDTVRTRCTCRFVARAREVYIYIYIYLNTTDHPVFVGALLACGNGPLGVAPRVLSLERSQ